MQDKLWLSLFFFYMNNVTTFFKNLEPLRFLAFLGVFNMHTILLSNSLHSSPITDVIFSILSFSYLGVPFFFSLSSFLITYRLLEEIKLNGNIKLRRFYCKRGLRIWPIYFLLLIICYVAIPIVFSLLHLEKPTLPNPLPFLFFWANFYIITNGVNFITALIVLWSLAIEEQFYIFWGFILKYVSKYLVLIIFMLLLLSIIFCYYYLYIIRQKEMNLKVHTLYAVPNFCLGALIAFVCHSKNKSFTFLKSLSTYFYGSIYFILITFNILKRFNVIHFDIIVAAVFNSFCYALILYDQTFNERRLFNIGIFKSINYLGRISYGLYIYHLLVASIMIKVFHFFNSNQNFYTSLLQAIITLLITILISHVSFRYFENYFLRLKEKL
ncbi:MAG: acyltransferase [Ginsengibacter sp.]